MTDDERFFAWLDDELSDGEAEAMATRVAADPALSALAEDHRALREKLGRAFSAISTAALVHLASDRSAELDEEQEDNQKKRCAPQR